MNPIKPKKALGQNFLNNKNLAQTIVFLVLASKPKMIVEIGPGTGVFTTLFSQETVLLGVEKDYDLSHLLNSMFTTEKIRIINADILEIDLKDYISKESLPLTIFGALPYNQSKKIILRMLEANISQHHYYIIQKEVAEKYVGRNSSNRLSIQSSLFADSKILLNINPANFTPKPKVTSSLIYFNQHKCKLNREELSQFYEFLHRAFKKPRKMLKNNLKTPEAITPDLSQLYTKRPAELNIDDYIKLFNLERSQN